MASPRTLAGLDWINFFAAAVQTGFGPFIAVYLTLHHWTGLAIGSVLSLGTITAMVSQIPAGALVDYMPNKRIAGGFGLIAIGVSALLLVATPTQFGVGLAEILHGFASCMLNPSIAALSLALVGGRALGERLGRNVRYSSLGNGAAAALLGAAGFWLAGASVFVLTALLTLPALFALSFIEQPKATPRAQPQGGAGQLVPGARAARPDPPRLPAWRDLRGLFFDRRLLAFALCLAFFQMSDAAMLPYVGRKIAGEAGNTANALIAACLVLPQIVVAALSPAIGRTAETRGRRFVLVVGFAFEPIRGVLFAVIDQPFALVMIQAMDGVGAAVIGIMLPLIAADISRERGHFNLTMGTIGVAVGGGAAASTMLAGTIDDLSGDGVALLALAGVGLLATLVVWLIMPESAPSQPDTKQA